MKKKCISFFVLLISFTVVWIISRTNFNPGTVARLDTDRIMALHCSGFLYHSVKANFVLYVLPFIVFKHLCSASRAEMYVIRYKDRFQYWIIAVKETVVSGILWVAAYALVDTIMLMWNYSVEDIFKSRLLSGYVVYLPALILYYVALGLIYELSLLFMSNITALIPVLICCVLLAGFNAIMENGLIKKEIVGLLYYMDVISRGGNFPLSIVGCYIHMALFSLIIILSGYKLSVRKEFL